MATRLRGPALAGPGPSMNGRVDLDRGRNGESSELDPPCDCTVHDLDRCVCPTGEDPALIAAELNRKRTRERRPRPPIRPGGREATDVLGRRYRVFTAAEVAAHNTPDDCWLIAHGRVYDVTSFLSKHPAGPKAILRRAGVDATRDFDFHSSGARKMWDGLLVGYLEGSSQQCTIM